MSDEIIIAINALRDHLEEIEQSIRKITLSAKTTKNEFEVIKSVPKEISVRTGIDILFTYPLIEDGFDKIISLEFQSDTLKIVEASSELKKVRTHLIRKADVISWV